MANDDAVESVVFSDSGVIGSLPAGAPHISSSTISVALSEKLEAAHAKAGQRFVAAPVFGRPAVAAEGQLFVIAAGGPDTVRMNTKACMIELAARRSKWPQQGYFSSGIEFRFPLPHTQSVQNLPEIKASFFSSGKVIMA